VDPHLATYTKGQVVTFRVTVLNQLNPPLNSTLALTVNGSGNYYNYDFQPVAVGTDEVKVYSFSWVIPNMGGTYRVEVGLAPAQLTAVDVVWLKIT
jgi:hypothetical protein